MTIAEFNKQLDETGDYLTPPYPVGRLIRDRILGWCDAWYYLRLTGIVRCSRRIAIRGEMNDYEWANTSLMTLRLVEGCGGSIHIENHPGRLSGETPLVIVANHMSLVETFLLPSILLSGFMFPFAGMPGWAQTIGTALPATHFMRLVRAVMLKGAGPAEIWGFVWPLVVILIVVASFAMARYRRTLD